MGKINFTENHLNQLKELILSAVFENTTFNGTMGTQYTVLDLLHNLTINTLISMKAAVKKQLDTLSSQDEWLLSDNDQAKIAKLKDRESLLNLIIGYKKSEEEKAQAAMTRRELIARLTALKESQKSPEDKIKELESQIAALD